MKKFILLLMLFSFIENIVAQNEVTSTPVKGREKYIAGLQVDSIMLLDSMAQRLYPLINQLIRDLRIQNNSNIETQQNNEELKKENDRLKIVNSDLTGKLDTMYVQIAMTYLSLKYSPTRVKFALEMFDRIANEQVKTEYSWVNKMLKEYEKSMVEVKTVVQRAQNDAVRMEKPMKEMYADAYMNKIKEMSYYKMYYRGKSVIEYLDNEITKVLKLLDAHKNKYQNYTADFTEVINNLTFEDTTGTVQ